MMGGSIASSLIGLSDISDGIGHDIRRLDASPYAGSRIGVNDRIAQPPSRGLG